MDVTRRRRLSHPTSVDTLLFPEVESLFRIAAFRRQRIRYLSLTWTDLRAVSNQLFLLDRVSPEEERQEALVAALDRIRGRYGDRAVVWGRTGLPGGGDMVTAKRSEKRITAGGLSPAGACLRTTAGGTAERPEQGGGNKPMKGV
jgi:hypothetical protein